MIRWSKLFITLGVILVGALVASLMAKKSASSHVAVPQMALSSLSAPLDLTSLTDSADVIAVGSVITISEQQPTTVSIGGHLVPARQRSALLNVSRILKGKVDTATLTFKFFASDATLYRGIPTLEVEMFFLRETSPREYAVLNPFYPFIAASEDAPPSDGVPLDKVVANLGHLLMNPAASLESRVEAVRALDSVKTEAATSALHQATQEQNASLRLEAAAALLRRNDISTLEMVTKSLLEPSADVNDIGRADAVLALQRIKDPRAIPALSRLLTKGDEQIRRGAAAALRHTGSSEAIGALAKALDDNDQQVRYSAVTGLAEITEETQGMPSTEVFKKNEAQYLAHWHARVSKFNLTPTP